MAYYKINGQKIPYRPAAAPLKMDTPKAPSNRVLEYGIILTLSALIAILGGKSSH